MWLFGIVYGPTLIWRVFAAFCWHTHKNSYISNQKFSMHTHWYVKCSDVLLNFYVAPCLLVLIRIDQSGKTCVVLGKSLWPFPERGDSLTADNV